MRNAHNGSIANWLPPHFYNQEQCGGGAFIDLGAHTIYLLEWILGQAKNISATCTSVTNRTVEDNVVAVIEFQKGAIGVAETSFVSVYTPLTLEISGTKGSLVVKSDVQYANEATAGKWVVADNVPATLPSPLVQWVEGVTQNKEISITIDDAISLTRIISAGYQSHESGQEKEV
ncbi:MAG: Gfo/Idh/MocA family oxidoreductase [Hyphomonadaceae bacterium]|nr:Gfo/Idh/MocA family oxidoreductase [Clostridia bacterium]